MNHDEIHSKKTFLTELNSFETLYFQFQNTHWKEELPDELDLEVSEELAPEIVVKDRSDPENLPLVLIEVRVFEVDQMDWDEDKNWVVTAKIINQKHKSYIRNEMWKLDLRKFSFQNRQKSQSRTKFTTSFPMVKEQKKNRMSCFEGEIVDLFLDWVLSIKSRSF